MTDKVAVAVGLVVFIALVTLPFWHTLGASADVAAPELELPEGYTQCVESKAYMTANHMDLLNRWRDAVVREGKKDYTSLEYGVSYEMSLTRTCLGCHTNKATFCDRCHDYASVDALVGGGGRSSVRCWDCHLESKGN
jgi:hypothetical protein